MNLKAQLGTSYVISHVVLFYGALVSAIFVGSPASFILFWPPSLVRARVPSDIGHPDRAVGIAPCLLHRHYLSSPLTMS